MTLIVGADAADLAATLKTFGITDIATFDGEVLRSEFDDDTDTWVLHTATDGPVQTQVVVNADPRLYVPWIPNFDGHNDFGGESFHSAQWDPHFDPGGKRIAVVGTDSWAAHRLRRLIESARSVIVFPHSPRRVVADMSRRRRRRSGPPVVRSAIEAVTESGLRTSDGVEHAADAIIYGTGFSLGDHALVGAGGLTIQQTWRDGMEPFLGVAVHGFPNYFFNAGPDTEAQARYIAQCLAVMERTGSRRIEVRRSSQQVFNERAQLAPTEPPAATGAFETFDLSSSAPDYEDTYDGAATLEIGGTRYPVHVRLIGHLDPLDGNYHWQGTVLDVLPDETLKRARAVTLSVGRHCAPARIVEQTPWGTHSVAGIGAPPYR